jgi:hypothetical protein
MRIPKEGILRTIFSDNLAGIGLHITTKEKGVFGNREGESYPPSYVTD